MKKAILTLTLLVGGYSAPGLAADAPWVFTSSLPSKEDTLRIGHKEFCRPISTQLMSNKCSQYKQGYVCSQDEGHFIISTYTNKKECDKALKKARRVLARQ